MHVKQSEYFNIQIPFDIPNTLKSLVKPNLYGFVDTMLKLK